MYGRRLVKPSDLLSHVRFIGRQNGSRLGLSPVLDSSSLASQALPSDDEIEASFILKFHRFMKGLGYPNHPLVVEFVAESELERVRLSQVFRAEQFLRLATGSELMPRDDWDITVSNIWSILPSLTPLTDEVHE